VDIFFKKSFRLGKRKRKKREGMERKASGVEKGGGEEDEDEDEEG